MEPPAARPRHRHSLSLAVPVVSVARRARQRSEAPALDYLRTWRAAGGGRLVDGGVGTFATRGSLAASPRHPSGAGAADIRRDRLDVADGGAAAAGRVAAESHRACIAGADLRATLSRRAGGGAARGPRLQHLA